MHVLTTYVIILSAVSQTVATGGSYAPPAYDNTTLVTTASPSTVAGGEGTTTALSGTTSGEGSLLNNTGSTPSTPTPAWAPITTQSTTAGPTTAPATTQTMAVTLPDVGAAGGIGTAPPVPWMTEWKFHCGRPNSQCDSMNGMCDPFTGRCNCFNQAFGERCQASNVAMGNAGVCLINNPCERGLCYDDGVGAKCACPDGYYGATCRLKMAHVECTQEKMVMNIYPYGFNDVLWDYIPPPSAGVCPLERMADFLAKANVYSSRGWQGFAREFLHKADPCAGDATIESSTTVDTIVYSREVFVYHDTERQWTDTKVTVTCQVPRISQTPGRSGGLPPPRVNIQVLDRVPGGRRLFGPVKLGTPLVVQFSVNPINNANIDDIRVETCTVTNGLGTSQRIIVIDNGCVVPPMGQKIHGGQQGTQFLTLLMYSFPNSRLLDFQCRVRLCDSVKHDACRTSRNCYRRKKRSGRRRTSQATADTIDVGFQFTG